MAAATITPDVERPRIGFSLFGGAIVWLIHLVASSLIAEWGCVSGLHRYQFLDITAIAWSVIALSVAALLVATAATWVAFRLYRHHNNFSKDSTGDQVYDTDETAWFLVRVGLWSNALFVFIIAAQGFPILYYLSDC
jgi:hypothetical protein